MRNLIARLEEAKAPATPNLDEYIAKSNRFRSPTFAHLGGQEILSKDTPSGRIAIFDRVDNDLSPENITWDGERPASEVRKAATYLKKVMQELFSIDPSLRNRPYG